jgi:hypothetical protein
MNNVGTFGVIQGTFGVIQGTLGVIRGTLDVIRGTCEHYLVWRERARVGDKSAFISWP